MLGAAHELRLPRADLDRIERSFCADEQAWARGLGQVRDVSALFAERNVFRYLPAEVDVRLGSGGVVSDLLRVVGAGLRARAQFTVSTQAPLPPSLEGALEAVGVTVRHESDKEWSIRAASGAVGRVRLIGGSAAELARSTNGRVELAVFDHPATEFGRLELLPFLKEQSVSITAHRFGTPDGLTDAVI